MNKHIHTWHRGPVAVLLVIAAAVAVRAVRLTSIPMPDQATASASSAGNTHEYFNSLVARPDHWKSYSLRETRQMAPPAAGGYAHANKRPPAVTYVFPDDPDPRKQDAAKVVVPARLNSLPNQMRLPMGTEDGHTYLITWDAWFGKEFRFSATGIGNYKTFQFDSPRMPGGKPAIWFELNNAWNLAPNDAGVLRARYYGGMATPPGPGTKTEPFGPSASQPFVIKSETWTRYWVLFEQRANNYDRMSLWVADSTRGPVHIFDGLQVSVLRGIQNFWVEYNTSTDAVAPGRGPLVSYIRNVVMLRDVANRDRLMVRP
jgi:hypothetical protein